jgi:hypothetical protein
MSRSNLISRQNGLLSSMRSTTVTSSPSMVVVSRPQGGFSDYLPRRWSSSKPAANRGANGMYAAGLYGLLYT